LGELVGHVEEAPEVIGDMNLTGRALNLGDALQCLAQLGAQRVDVDLRLPEQRSHRAAILIEQGNHEVNGFDELVIPSNRQRLGIRHGHLELAGQFVHSHRGYPLLINSPTKDKAVRRSFKAGASNYEGRAANPGGIISDIATRRKRNLTILPPSEGEVR